MEMDPCAALTASGNTTSDAAADVLLLLWYKAREEKARQGYGGPREELLDAGSWHNRKGGSTDTLDITPCVGNDDFSDTSDSENEDDQLTWKQLRARGWSYVPGSRLGESLIDYFYLPPGVSAEGAVKYKNAFVTMAEVSAPRHHHGADAHLADQRHPPPRPTI